MNREVTEQQLQKFKLALEQWNDAPPENVHPTLHRLAKETIVSQIEDLEQQLRESENAPSLD